MRSSSIFLPNGTVVTPASRVIAACRSTVISCASKASTVTPRRAASVTSLPSMNRSISSSRSGASRWAASAYLESVASSPAPSAGSSSAAFVLARPVR